MKHFGQHTTGRRRAAFAAAAALVVCLLCCVALSACQTTRDTLGPFAGEGFEEGIGLAFELADDVPVMATDEDVLYPLDGEGEVGQPVPSRDNRDENDDSVWGDATDGEEKPGSGNTSSSATSPSKPDYSGMEYEEDVLLVSPTPGSSIQDVAAALSIDPSAITESSANLLEVKLPHGTQLEDAVETLQNSGTVESAQPNFIYYLQDEIPSSLESQKEANDAEVEDSETATISVEPIEEEQLATAYQEENREDIGLSDDENLDSEAGQDDNSDTQESPIIQDDPQIKDANEGTDARGSTPSSTTLEDDNSIEVESNPEEPTASLQKLTPNDPYISKQWGLESINALEAWYELEEAKSNPVAVALIDEGFEMTHEDLQSCWITDGDEIVSYNAVSGVKNDYRDMKPVTTQGGHGTHVAGILSARVNNKMGIAGVSYNQKLLPIKVFPDSGAASTAILRQAYEYIFENAEAYNIRVVNMSVGVTGKDMKDEILEECIDRAYQQGIVTVCSAGNFTANAPATSNFPSDIDEVVSVINLRQLSSPNRYGDDVARASNSNYNRSGEKLKDIAAPGTDIFSTYPRVNNKNKEIYDSNSGTSMAAPSVSGVLAMMFSANSTLSAQEAVDILYATAADIGEEGFDAETGWGEVDAASAVHEAIQATGTFDDSANASLPRTALNDPDPVISWEKDEEEEENPISSSTSSSDKAGESDDIPRTGKSGISLADATVAKIAAYYYSGKAINPSPKVSYKGKVLALGTDYSLSYQDNKAIGTATVTVKGKGQYTGMKKATFKIIARPVYRIGASEMPIGSTSAWKLSHCKLKVVSGASILKAAKDGTVTAKKKGTAKVAIIDDAGRKVKTCKVKVYKLTGAHLVKSSKKQSLALAVKGASKASNAAVVLGKAKSKPAKSQLFKFVRSGSTYRIQAVHSGKYLAVKSSSKKQGAAVVQKKRSSANVQKWKITVDKKNRLIFTNVKTGKVLAVKSTVKNGAKVVQQASTDSLTQKWVLG